jgi:hypothetical protein
MHQHNLDQLKVKHCMLRSKYSKHGHKRYNYIHRTYVTTHFCNSRKFVIIGFVIFGANKNFKFIVAWFSNYVLFGFSCLVVHAMW